MAIIKGKGPSILAFDTDKVKLVKSPDKIKVANIYYAIKRFSSYLAENLSDAFASNDPDMVKLRTEFYARAERESNAMFKNALSFPSGLSTDIQNRLKEIKEEIKKDFTLEAVNLKRNFSVKNIMLEVKNAASNEQKILKEFASKNSVLPILDLESMHDFAFQCIGQNFYKEFFGSYGKYVAEDICNMLEEYTLAYCCRKAKPVCINAVNGLTLCDKKFKDSKIAELEKFFASKSASR